MLTGPTRLLLLYLHAQGHHTTTHVRYRIDDNSRSQTRKQEPPGRHRLGPKRFRCMRRRPRYRSNISVTAGTARAPVVLDNHCTRLSADRSTVAAIQRHAKKRWRISRAQWLSQTGLFGQRRKYSDFARKCSSTKMRIAEDRLPCCRPPSISAINSEIGILVHALFPQSCQKASSRLILVLCRLTTTERFMTVDFIALSSYSRSSA